MLVALVVTEAVAIALLGLLVAGLLRSHGEVLRTLHRIGAGIDPTAGSAADLPMPTGGRITRPEGAVRASRLVGVTLADEAVSLPLTDTGRDTLLVFLSGGCETCLPIWQALAEGVTVPGNADLVVVTGGPERESESLLRRLAPPTVPLVMSSAAWDDYAVPGSPHFVYVDGATGTIVGEGTAPSWPQVMSLLERAVGDRTAAAAKTAGTAVPRTVSGRDQDAPDTVDAELAAAGIQAGHPSLYADPHGHSG